MLEKNVHQKKEALVYTDGENRLAGYSYREICEEIQKTALQFTDRQPFDRILLNLPSGPSLAFSFFGAIYAGMIPVPVSPRLTAEEVEFIINDCKPAQILTADTIAVNTSTKNETRQSGMHIEHKTRGEDPAFLIYTSGTSGYPKGVLHAQRSILGRIPMKKGWTGLCSSDRLFHTGELNWTYTLGVGLMDTWAASATAILYGGPREKEWFKYILHACENESVTILASVPGIYRKLIAEFQKDPKNRARLHCLRHGLSAGEALSPGLLKSWQDSTGTNLYEALGMSEISTYISTGPGMQIKPGSPGKPQEGRKITLLDPDTKKPALFGLIAVDRNDPGLMLGYWNRPEEEKEVMYGQWFAGGDLAAIDSDGYIHYRGRNNELLNAGGYRVSPLEIENVLHQHSAVEDVAVKEVEIKSDVKIITAFITVDSTYREKHKSTVYTQDAEKAMASKLEKELIAYCHKHLADYKCPRKIIFRKIPRTQSGKLRRKELPDRLV